MSLLQDKYGISPEAFIQRYWTNGESLNRIAQDIGAPNTSLTRYALRDGIHLKAKHQVYDDRVAANETRQYFVKQDFFDKWSAEMAWVLGLIASDGCVREKENRWTLTSKDLECLEKVACLIDYTGTIRKKSNRPAYDLRISSLHMVKSLIGLGMTPAKSLTLRYPDMPEEYERHFIRGVFDGDGCITIGEPRVNTGHRRANVTFTTGSESFAHILLERLISIGLQPSLETMGPHLQKWGSEIRDFKNPTFHIYFNGPSVARFYEYIYGGVPESQSMARKRNKFNRWYTAHSGKYPSGLAWHRGSVRIQDGN